MSDYTNGAHKTKCDAQQSETDTESVMDSQLSQSVEEFDPELYQLILGEKRRQCRGLELIASENFTSRAVLQLQGSCLHNKYSEGRPGARYYGGNEYIDQVSATAVFFEPMPYKLDPASGQIDYDRLQENAKLFNPKLIIAGVSCYPRNLDYERFRRIADNCGALLLADMAHISGLVAAGVVPSPFAHCDLVTTTTHKSLRGPRAAIIFYRKGVRGVDKSGAPVQYQLADRIHQAVFPGLQGGPHNHSIAAMACALLMAQQPEFKTYQQQVLKNARALASGLIEAGYRVVTDGTDNHIVWLDLRSFRPPHTAGSVDAGDAGDSIGAVKLSGSKAERILEKVSIACNKNTVPGDKSAFNPSGIRLGTPALTTRGLKEHHFHQVVAFICEALHLAREITAVSGTKMVDFERVLNDQQNPHKFCAKVQQLRERVECFADQFYMPGQEGL